MGVIHWRLKNVFLLLVLLTVVFIVFNINFTHTRESILEFVYGEDETGPCNKEITYLDKKLAKKWPVIGLVGPPGSGVVWLRFLIEQLSGLHTGSTTYSYNHLFTAEGKTKRVVVVMAHDISSIRHITAGIIVYRRMEETIRSQFASKHGEDTALEAPMEAYYGKEWETFAVNEGTAWTQHYKDYTKTNIPLVVVNYDELDESEGLKKQLLHISHFLHVPIRQSTLDCLVERAIELEYFTDYRPKSLRYGFHPFELLTEAKRSVLDKYQNFTEKLVSKARDGYLPRVHV